MKQALKNIFQDAEPEKRICTIEGNILPGVWSVSDSSGRIFRVESDAFWRPGETVVVQSGRIVSRASRLKFPTTYDV
jgi:hypothetical protein